MNASDSSDDELPVYRSRQHHAKYSDLMASRVSRATANACKYNEMLPNGQRHKGCMCGV